MSIPSVSLSQFENGSAVEKNAFVQSLGMAFQTVGFVAVAEHGFDEINQGKLYQSFFEFFSLKEGQKLKYARPDLYGQRGYTGKKREHAKGSTLADLKEFYHIGQSNPPKELHLQEAYPDNIWPLEIPNLQVVGLEAFKTLEKIGITLLRAIALWLQLPEDYFDQHVISGNSILRAIHYYPLQDESFIELGAVRAAAHEDINLITLLMGASAEGLEILHQEGYWVPVTALPGQLVVNVGDMLSRLTNDRLKSTTHRVVNPSAESYGKSRYSIPFFMHPRADMPLNVLPNCISNTNPKKYEDCTAGKFLTERLKEIGLLPTEPKSTDLGEV